MSRSFRAALVVVVAIAVQGCYHTRVLTGSALATEYRHTTVHPMFWGLVQDNVVPDNCPSGAMQEVRVTSNFGYSLLTVVTLGIWSPLDIEWHCAKNPPPPLPPGQ